MKQTVKVHNTGFSTLPHERVVEDVGGQTLESVCVDIQLR